MPRAKVRSRMPYSPHTYSHHAYRRMDKRLIREAEMEHAITTGVRSQARGGLTMVSDGYLRVVLDGRHVVTCYGLR